MFKLQISQSNIAGLEKELANIKDSVSLLESNVTKEDNNLISALDAKIYDINTAVRNIDSRLTDAIQKEREYVNALLDTTVTKTICEELIITSEPDADGKLSLHTTYIPETILNFGCCRYKDVNGESYDLETYLVDNVTFIDLDNFKSSFLPMTGKKIRIQYTTTII